LSQQEVRQVYFAYIGEQCRIVVHYWSPLFTFSYATIRFVPVGEIVAAVSLRIVSILRKSDLI